MHQGAGQSGFTLNSSLAAARSETGHRYARLVWNSLDYRGWDQPVLQRLLFTSVQELFQLPGVPATLHWCVICS